MSKITVYERYYFIKNIYLHNHIVNGHIPGDKPKPIHKSKFQALEWRLADGWRITYTNLIKGKVERSDSDKVETYFRSPKLVREGCKMYKT